MTEHTKQTLITAAIAAREAAYAPYSNFMVGAALLGQSGKVYTGCNIENAGQTASACAERTAFFKAISEGETAFTAIAVVGATRGAPLAFTAPCGVCRQVMMEFCDYETFQIILAVSETDSRTYTLQALLPFGFGPNNLA